jgi:hypothetical protein
VSRTERVDPIWLTPYSDMLEPMRKIFLKEQDEPRVAKSNTLNELLNLPTP